eukprot:1753517-Pyramimonas_sp.AAC.1
MLPACATLPHVTCILMDTTPPHEGCVWDAGPNIPSPGSQAGGAACPDEAGDPQKSGHLRQARRQAVLLGARRVRGR